MLVEQRMVVRLGGPHRQQPAVADVALRAAQNGVQAEPPPGGGRLQLDVRMDGRVSSPLQVGHVKIANDEIRLRRMQQLGYIER